MAAGNSLFELTPGNQFVRDFGIGSNDIYGLAAANGYLFAAKASAGTVTEYQLGLSGTTQVGQLTGLNSPEGMVVSGGKLYVAETGLSQVRVFDANTLVEQPESGIGKGYLSGQAYVNDVSVDAVGQEIYVTNGTQVVVYGLDGIYHRAIAVTRETTQICFRAGVLYVGGRNAIYNYEWTYGHIQAVDPLSGTVLGSEDSAAQTTDVIGNWVLPNSIRFTSGGLMLRGDLSLPRVEIYQPIISSSYYQSAMSIVGPLMSLQNNGPFAVNGTVNVYNIASWMLQLGKTNSLTGIFNPLLTVASGVSNTSGALGSVDLTQMPDGVYSLRLTATNTSGANIVTSTAVSKGEWQYTGMLTGISPANGYVVAAEYPKIGHDYIAAAPIWGGDYKAHILELNQNGQYVAENTYSDFNVLRGLAVDGDNLIVSGMENDGGSNSYMSGNGRAFVRSFNLASADGQGLGALTSEYDGMSSPTGLVAVNGVVYVAEFSANKIVELPENNLAAGPIGTIQSIYLSADWSMDIAVDRVPGSEELYVGNGQGVVVFDLQGTFHRQFSWNFTVGGLWFDTSTGILYVVDVTNQQVVAYNGQTGACLGRTETRQDSTQLDGQFTQPTYLKLNSAGSLMVGNWLQNRVQLIKPNFTAVRTIVWPTVTNTPTISPTYSSTPTVTASLTCTMTPTSSVSASATLSATGTPTASQSPTWSSSPTPTMSATSTATPTICAVAPNTVAVYYFAPGAGYSDSSGNGWTLTEAGCGSAEQFIADPTAPGGSYVHFHTNDNCLHSVNLISALNSVPQWTIECFFRTAQSLPADDWVWGFENGSYNGLALTMYPGGNSRISGGGLNAITACATSALVNNGWNHIAFVNDYVNGNSKIYLNGVLVNSVGSGSGFPLLITNGGNLRMVTGGDALPYDLAMLRVSNSARISFPTLDNCSSATPPNTFTATFTVSASPTGTSEPTPTSTDTNTATPTASMSPTGTSEPTPSSTATGTATATASMSPTETSEPTPSNTATDTATPTASMSPTETGEPTPSGTATGTATAMVSMSSTETSEPTPTRTATGTATPTVSMSSTETSEPTPTSTATGTATPTSSMSPTGTSEPTPTNTATGTTTPTASISPTVTSEPTLAYTASNTNTCTATQTVSKTPTYTASASPSSSCTLTPTCSAPPSKTPSMTSSSSASATASGTYTPTTTPTQATSLIPCLSRAIDANGSVMINGATIDSYHSSVGAYGGSNITADASIQAGGSITINSGGVVDGQEIANTPPNLTSLPTPAYSFTNLGALLVANGQIVSLQAGDYGVTSITVNQGGVIKGIGGQVRIWFNGNLIQNGQMYPDSGKPGDLWLIGSSQNTTLTLNGGCSTSAVIYAPAATVQVNAAMIGAVACSTITFNSGAALHFDEDMLCGSGVHNSLSIRRVTASQSDSSNPARAEQFITYPNPAWNIATVSYMLDDSASVECALVNLAGEACQRFIMGPQTRGPHTVRLEVKSLASGVYWVMLRVDSANGFKRMYHFKLAIVH